MFSVRKKTFALVAALAVFVGGAATAAPLTFDLTNAGGSSFTQGGVTLDLTSSNQAGGIFPTALTLGADGVGVNTNIGTDFGGDRMAVGEAITFDFNGIAQDLGVFEFERAAGTDTIHIYAGTNTTGSSLFSFNVTSSAAGSSIVRVDLSFANLNGSQFTFVSESSLF